MFRESIQDAWQARYGTDAPMEADLGALLNHRSVRKFKAEPVEESLVSLLIGAAQSAATSSNLQLYSFVSVQEPSRREAIARLCDPNPQVRSAPWFFAVFADHWRAREAAKAAGHEPSSLSYAEFYTMAVVDAALAAERMVCAAETLGLGICYIGGLRNHPDEVNRLLAAPKGVFGLFGLCIGWPEEPLRAEIKPRLSQAAVWFRDIFPAGIDAREYDERIAPFYERQKVSGPPTWSEKTGQRLEPDHLGPRAAQKSFLEDQGFLLD